MIEMLLPMLLGGLKWLVLLFTFIALKKYILMGAAIFLLYIIVKGLSTMIELFTTIINNKVLRWICGLSLICLICFITGYCSHHAPVVKPDQVVKEVNIRRYAEHIRSKALIKNGETYYSRGFVNELLKRHNVTGVELKNIPSSEGH